MGNINFHKTKRILSFVTNKSEIEAPDKKTRILIEEVKGLLTDPAFDNKLILNHVLNKICLITGAEYGCICKLDYDTFSSKPRIYRYAATNISWDSHSNSEFRTTLSNLATAPEQNKEVASATLGACIYRSFINNEYDDTCSIRSGHPGIKRYMSVPCSFGLESLPSCTIYVCNKLEEFTKKDAIHAASVLNAVSHLFT